MTPEDEYLEEISDKIRMGLPVGIREALVAIEYQAQKRKKKKWWQFWKK